MLSWSSGLGCHPLTVEAAGSNPAGSEQEWIVLSQIDYMAYNSWNSRWGSVWDRPMFVNEKIKAFTVMVLDENWTNLWTMPRARALATASEQWLDLVQVSYNPKDKICTAKLVDLGKYLYEKKKKVKETKKQQKQQSKWLKQVKMRYSISDHDMNMKLDKVKEFLSKGYTVKILFQLRWRERVFKRTVIDRLNKIKDDFSALARLQYPLPKEEKNGYSLVLIPAK